MTLIPSYLLLLGFLAVGALFFNGAVRLLRANKSESEKNAARVSSLPDAIMGRARTRVDWMPDARVKGGLVFNRAKNRIEISGRMSEHSLDRVFK